MSKRVAGDWNALELELQTGLRDGAESWRYRGVVSDFPESDDQSGTGSAVVWTCEPDDLDSVDVLVPADVLDVLRVRARAHCEACPGCNRA